MPYMTFLPSLLLALLLAPGAHADECGTTDDLSARDTEAIVTLARRVGMAGALRVCGDYYGAPIGCPAVRVDSLPRIDGNKRSWQRLYLGRSVKGQEACPWWERGSAVYWRGGWVAAKSNLHDMASWRFTRGPLEADVILGETISHELADRIIGALHDHTWQDALDADGRQLMNAWWEPARLAQISSIYGNAETGYDVRFGEMGGMIIRVEVNGAAIRLTAAGIYYV